MEKLPEVQESDWQHNASHSIKSMRAISEDLLKIIEEGEWKDKSSKERLNLLVGMTHAILSLGVKARDKVIYEDTGKSLIVAAKLLQMVKGFIGDGPGPECGPEFDKNHCARCMMVGFICSVEEKAFS